MDQKKDQEKTFEEVLELFAQLPKENREPTFMELCRYPYNREAHDRFLKENRKNQEERIASLKEQISQRTRREWWAWENRDLGISFNDEGNRIGIESHYEISEDGPCGIFDICITTWKRHHWNPHKEAVLEVFERKEIASLNEEAYGGGRVYLWLKPLQGKDEQAIIERPAEVYNKMRKITQRIK